VEKYNELFGFETIDYLVADREFIGENWLEYLNLNGIKYHMRIRDNFKVYKNQSTKLIKATYYKVGISIDFNEQKIKIKKHVYRSKSLFRYGLHF
jgi:hypothetical protein